MDETSIPACHSANYPECLGAETAADHKLQADMDQHQKDYFVPNFGLDSDIMFTQHHIKAMEKIYKPNHKSSFV